MQHRLRLAGADVARLLRDDEAFVYLCGHKKMEAGVLAAFAQISSAHGLDGASLLPRLKAEGRFHLETYWGAPLDCARGERHRGARYCPAHDERPAAGRVSPSLR